MTEVYRRKLALDKYTPTLTAVTLFYSRIILKKLTTENKTTFRKLEKSVKFSVKCDADIKFMISTVNNNKIVKKTFRDHSASNIEDLCNKLGNACDEYFAECDRNDVILKCE